jgi:hypothetical protein
LLEIKPRKEPTGQIVLQKSLPRQALIATIVSIITEETIKTLIGNVLSAMGATE